MESEAIEKFGISGRHLQSAGQRIRLITCIRGFGISSPKGDEGWCLLAKDAKVSCPRLKQAVPKRENGRGP